MPFRPWKTLEEMNEGLITNHNSIVKPEDICIHLGDLVMGKKFENVPKIIPRLNGSHILIPGNHCFLPSALNADKLKSFEDLYLSNGIEKIYYGCIKLSDITKNNTHNKINMCHFPPPSVPDHSNQYEQRYKDLHPEIKEDEYLLCGHAHSREHLLTKNVYHCGIDALIHEYKPVSLDLVLERLGIKL